MKPFLILLWVTCCCEALAQTNANYTLLKLNIKDCRPYSRWIPDTAWLYSLPENKLAFVLTSYGDDRPYGKQKLATGEYRIKFKNIHHQYISKVILLQNRPMNEVELCADSLDSYPQNVLAQLKNEDSLVIHYSFHGCMSPGAFEKLVITRKDRSLIAQYFKIMDPMQNPFLALIPEGKKSEIPYELQQTITLNNKQQQDFIRFENELNCGNRPSGCMYACDEYFIISKYLNMAVTDLSCKWEGWDHLLSSFLVRSEN